jgi:hypothetical protein
MTQAAQSYLDAVNLAVDEFTRAAMRSRLGLLPDLFYAIF